MMRDWGKFSELVVIKVAQRVFIARQVHHYSIILDCTFYHLVSREPLVALRSLALVLTLLALLTPCHLDWLLATTLHLTIGECQSAYCIFLLIYYVFKMPVSFSNLLRCYIVLIFASNRITFICLHRLDFLCGRSTLCPQKNGPPPKYNGVIFKILGKHQWNFYN